MKLREAPALAPAAVVVAGVVLAPRLVWLPVPLVVALAALGWALGRRAGPCVVAAALGLAAGLVGEPAPEVRSGGLVTVEGEVVGHPIRDDGWRFAVAVDRLRRGSASGPFRVSTAGLAVTVVVAGEAEKTTSPPAFGSRLRLIGTLSRSPGYANATPVSPGPWRLRVKSSRFVDEVAGPPPWAILGGRLRRLAEDAVATLDPTGRRPGAALAAGAVLGDRSRLADATLRGLRRSGLLHLLAVSGLHVSLVALLAFAVAAPLGRHGRLLAAAGTVLVYLLLVGPQPSVLRATGMGLLAAAALLGERPPSAVNALAVVAAAMVAVEPRWVDDLGFQLSASATFGLLALGPAVAERLRPLPGWLRQALGASLAAQLAVLPFLLPVAAGVNPLAPLLNLAAIPWLGVALAVSIAGLALVAALPAAGPVVAAVLDVLAAPLTALALLPAHPLLFLPLSLPPAIGARADDARAGVEAVFLDVGQGSATLLRDDRRAVLVDGGGWPRGDLGGRVLVPALVGLGVRRLDAVVLSHGDSDHCRGLVDLVAYLPVAEVWTGPIGRDEACAWELVRAPGVAWRPWRPEERRAIGRWRLERLHPAAADRFDGNDGSLVVRAEALGRRLLLTGDVELPAERALVGRLGDDLGCDVLAVAHHGSGSSTGEPFLRRARPRLAIVSAGVANPYGHPARVVLDRLRRAGIPTLRTDRDGAVHLRLSASGTLAIELPGSPRAGSATIER